MSTHCLMCEKYKAQLAEAKQAHDNTRKLWERDKREQRGSISNLLPDMTYEEAAKLREETDYAFEATHQDENPIHGPDATAFFLEGYLYARKQLTEILSNAQTDLRQRRERQGTRQCTDERWGYVAGDRPMPAVASGSPLPACLSNAEAHGRAVARTVQPPVRTSDLP